MLIIRNKRSTTLFEIIVATVIFSLVMAGMVSVFVAGKRHVMHARDRMTSSEMGKLFLEPLQMFVSQETWEDSGNPLYGGTTTGAPVKVNNVNFTPTYDVSDVGSTDLRRVVSTVNWTEN